MLSNADVDAAGHFVLDLLGLNVLTMSLSDFVRVQGAPAACDCGSRWFGDVKWVWVRVALLFELECEVFCALCHNYLAPACADVHFCYAVVWLWHCSAFDAVAPRCSIVVGPKLRFMAIWSRASQAHDQ